MNFALRLRRRCWIIPVIAASVVAVMGIEPSNAQTGRTDLPRSTQETMSEYQRLIKDGARFNATGDFQSAEAAYRRAVILCQSHYGENASVCGNAVIRLGLEISNQGRFEDADRIFGAANNLAQRSASPFAIPRYLIYRAMDMSNRDEFDRARRLVLAANKRYSVLLKTEVATDRFQDENAKERVNSILLEFAHGLYVHAGIAQRVGRKNEAILSLKLAKDVAAKIPGAPQAYLDDLDKVLRSPPPPRPQISEQPEEELNSE
ncbi:MAG: hypothetical protein GKS00_26420 [Alphaproteobacteria bacterium]|nr:hypothetical protein [Alphaproteobacteria bacterium]